MVGGRGSRGYRQAMVASSIAVAPRRPGRPRSTHRDGDLRSAAIEAARSLLVSGGGAALSMEGLARALGVRAPSLYHHFPGGRDEMILAVGDHYSRLDGDAIAAIAQGPGSPIERLAAVARHFAGPARHHPYHTLTGQRETLKPAAQAELQRLFAERVEMPLLALVREGQDAGLFRAIDAELSVRVFLTLVLRLKEFEASAEQRSALPDFIISLLIEGLGARVAQA